MARDGYRIFDSDTHVGPDAAILDRYLSRAEKDRLAAWEEYRSTGRNGHVTYTKGQRRYRRKLGAAMPEESPGGYMAGFTGVARRREPSPEVDADPAARIADMDYEGVDVNLTLPSGWFGTWTAGDDIALEMAMYRAYHRWMSDYCGAFPRRLGGVILAGSRDIAGSLAEMRQWGRDTWDNLWLQRSAAHPWCGMRNMAALIGSGVMDRYPEIRIATLEAGHGWLPFWIARIDEHARTVAAALPKLERKPSEYV